MPLQRIPSASIAVLASLMTATTLASASDAPFDYLWPMPLRPAVSSSFCEYREGHLHAGIDIRTFGEEGVVCRASGDGYVSRVRASEEGYGKVVYLQLESGETLVYAHLSEFVPELDAVVRSEQERRGRYRVDLRLSPSRYPVRRGERVGYSGMTGATAPHLHFEVRNEQEHPVDPFSNGFAVDDALPPEFDRVRLVPLARDARIEGGCYPRESPVTRVAAAQYALADTMTLDGSVGLSVLVFDRLNGESGRLAPHDLEFAVDGESVARITLDAFSFGHTDQVDFLYEVARVRTHKESFIQLYRRSGETLWGREFKGGGAFPVGLDRDGVHAGQVTARDRAGNASTLDFCFRVGPTVLRGRRRSPSEELPGCFFYEGLFIVSSQQRSYPLDRWAPLIAGVDIGGDLLAAVPGVPPVPVELPVKASFGAPSIYVVGARQGEPRSFRFANIDLEIVMGERTLYSDQVLYATSWLPGDVAMQKRELVPRKGPIRIGPYAMSLNADMEIRFTDVSLDTADAIYRLGEPKGEWVYYESVISGGVISTTARRPGIYGVFADRFGPAIRQPFLATGKRYAGVHFRELVVPIEDTGSGVDYSRSEVAVGGKRQIARWDDVSKKMFVDIRDPNIIGRNAVRVDAYDQIGNHSRLDAMIDFPNAR